jgi:hypothetical protein
MPSLRCGHCEQLFEYREKIVALRDTEGGVVAEPEMELEAGTVEGALQPFGKFHLSCYEAMREGEPEKWPNLAYREASTKP